MPVRSRSRASTAATRSPAPVLDVPQPVHLGVVARPDDPALPDGKGRLVHDGPVDEPAQAGQVVHPRRQGLQQGRGQGGEELPQPGQLPQPGGEGDQVPPPRGAVDDAADEPLQVGHLPQGGGELLAGDGRVHQGLHRAQPPADGGGGEEGPLHPGPDEPVAHGGAGLVQHPQKAPLLLLGAQGLGELQVPPGGEVQFHVLPLGQPGQGGEVAQVGLLGLIEIVQQAPRRPDGKGPRRRERPPGRRRTGSAPAAGPPPAGSGPARRFHSGSPASG